MAGVKLTKAEIVEKIHEEVKDVSRKSIQKIMDKVFDQIKEGIREDKIIELRGFGTFEVKLRRGRTVVRNPKTGEVFPGKNHGVVGFRPGQELKQVAWPMRQ